MYHSVLSPEVRRLAQKWNGNCENYVFGKPSQDDIDRHNEELRKGLVQLEILSPNDKIVTVFISEDYVCMVETEDGTITIPLGRPVRDITFAPTGFSIYHYGIAVVNPTESECGRFTVSPGYYGFMVYNTGGGNTCWRLDCKLGTRWYQMILTDGNMGHDGELQDINLYESEGPDDELGTVCVFSASFKDLP